MLLVGECRGVPESPLLPHPRLAQAPQEAALMEPQTSLRTVATVHQPGSTPFHSRSRNHRAFAWPAGGSDLRAQAVDGTGSTCSAA